MADYGFPDPRLNKAMQIASTAVAAGVETGEEVGVTRAHLAVAFATISAQMMAENLERDSAVQFLRGMAAQIGRGEAVAVRVATGNETVN